ncbi:hypothetical protein MNEG_0439 [Monoraphidium neglectum]|uniref:Protein kinase domain-containing protein n=1 Tax=Monoraphidium neglectum TaxID=145388 RepID=A0A0D2MYE0_9CHLO|nr:hypothetical protein MNEG_0439 [Monoraphidium neglectum]KIZ07505.1 hypothetical protein MNEG_0439 [Monoraphidium neglectum]|eukprot:XP_013906524.1 hypothetical protein MNEG_0439 [Monoraphidium neglectum]
MAVLSSVRHPNIVQAYACMPDVALETEASAVITGETNGTQVLRFRNLLPNEVCLDATACDIMVMELCDRGTLKDALAQGALPAAAAALSTASSGGITLLEAVLGLLIEMAATLHYLHQTQVVHGGVKASALLRAIEHGVAENILLKSDLVCPLGFKVKLAGFGSAKILGQGRGDIGLQRISCYDADIARADDVSAFGV